MGWFIRKSFRLGRGIRINLSKRGLGISGGVKGARISTGPRGTEIYGGRKGLYYRKRISRARKKKHDDDAIGEGSGLIVTLLGLLGELIILAFYLFILGAMLYGIWWVLSAGCKAVVDT